MRVMRGRQVLRIRGEERMEVTIRERMSRRVGMTDRAGGLVVVTCGSK
jgi:hypothetical protein